MFRKASLILAFLLAASASYAQTVKQSGTVTPGHATKWVTTGIIGDAGTAASGSLTSLGVTNNGGPGICVNSDLTTAAGYNQLCLSVTTNGGAKLSSYAYGTAASAGFTFDVNGSTQGFLTATLPVVSGNIACFTGTSGNIRDCGAASVPGGANTDIQFNNSGAFGGSTSLTWISPTLTVGLAGSTTGQLGLTGASGGTAFLKAQATAGSPTFTFGNTSGTPAAVATSPLAIAASTGTITCATCVTSSGGGTLSASAPVTISAGGNIAITGAAGQVLAGAGPTFTASPTLGASGTLGSLILGNATSGLITLQPVTGVLGTVTVSLPAATDTLVGKATTDTLTNKTLTAPVISGGTIDNAVIGGGTPAAASLTATTISGLLRTTFGTPTIASGACGTTANGVITSGTNQAGLITIGAASTTTCTISFSATLANAPNACVIFPQTAGAAATGTTVARVSSVTTGGFVITGSALATTAYYYLCI